MRARLLSTVGLVAAGVMTPTTALADQAGTKGDVVVQGVRAKLSDWREAETDHVIVLSDGDPKQLITTATNLERLHWLLTALFGRINVPDDTVKLRVTLIGDAAQFEELELGNKRWQQGPYNDLFRLPREYDPRDDGSVMTVARVDQRTVIEHTTINPRSVQASIEGIVSTATPGLASNLGALMSVESDFATADMHGEHELSPTFNVHAINVSAQNLLYAGYAQHFLLTYFPAAYPRWYVDGFGQVFASFATQGANQLTFGRSPNGTMAVLDEFGAYPLSKVLDDSYLTANPHRTRWTPIHAWVLTHFLLFSDTYRPKLNRYLALRAAGADAATAAEALGDPKQLAAALRHYYAAKKPYDQVTYTPARDDAPVVRRLTVGEAAFVTGRLELGERVTLPNAPEPGTDPAEAARETKKRDAALSRRDRWLAGLQSEAARWPNELGAQLLLAEAECRSDHGPECLAAAGRAQAIAPKDATPLAWRGMALVIEAAAAPADARPALVAQARQAIAAANRIDQDAVEPLLAYYASYARTGEAPTATALDAVQKVVSEVPNAPTPRLQLATGLAARGNTDAARQVILPVAAGAYDSPERPAARALLAQAGAPAAAQPVGGQAGSGEDTPARAGSGSR